MSRFNDVDLTQLPAPQLIDTISYEAILAELKAWVLMKWAEVRVARPDLPPLETLTLETEPITIILEALAGREVILRALVNDKARAVLLAFAVGADLEHIAALFGVTRMIENGVAESDDRLRRRVQLAPEAFSVAGPAGAYEFHALTQSLAIADAHAFSPADGRVTVALAGVNGAEVSDDVIAAVVKRYDRDDLVPLTDQVSVIRPERVFYDVTANLLVSRGPDPELIKVVASASLRSYAAERYRIARETYRVGITAALKVGGVDNVILTTPGDIDCSDSQVAVLRDVNLTTTIP
jgi:phage-related baseplate assembly protein